MPRWATRFGPLWATYWFQVGATVPEEWAGERVDLLWISHSEATLWIGGRSVQGLNTSPMGARIDAQVLESAAGGERLDLRVELACNGKFGKLDRPFASREPVVLDRCQIARFDRRGVGAAPRLRRAPPAGGGRRERARRVVGGPAAGRAERFCNVWSEDDRASWARSRAILGELLAHRNGSHVHALSAIGHGHIDTAWLWPLAETYRKAVRTFSSQTAYMERYPEFRFACSQAQQYDWIRARNPDLYGRIRRQVEAGRWVPVGGTWIEPDCNLPSGESLVRQFLHGQRFFEREFGRRCNEFWNPDVFGYNGQLPQIMRGAGIGRFLTQKLSWNRFNPPPHHTFTWQGIDGSQVLAHFPPADTYNATVEVAELRRTARDYKDHDRSGRSLLVFGYGDGGGGPTPEMLETLRRVRRPAGRAAHGDDDQRRVLRRAGGRRRGAGDGRRRAVLRVPPRHVHHPGRCQERQPGRASGRCTTPSSCAAVARGGEHPRERLAELWQLLLLNQFHDILPGSSIAEVYEDAARDHAAVIDGAERLVAEALGEGEPATPLNTIGFARAEVARRARSGSRRRPTASVGSSEAPDAVAVTETADAIVLENGRLRAELGRDGLLRSLVELSTGREALAAPGNVMQLYDDRPTAYDAWDVDPFHLETVADAPPATSCTVIRDEPAARRGGDRAADRPRQHDAPGRAAGRRLAAARVPLRGRLARVATRC